MSPLVHTILRTRLGALGLAAVVFCTGVARAQSQSQPTIPKPAGLVADAPQLISPGSGPTWRIEYKFPVGDVQYLTFDNDYGDSGGVQPLLTYSTSLKERRYIKQTVLKPTTQPAGAKSELSQIQWECDRYEAREKGMKEESVFDSLRHLYPPPALYTLGTIPESKSLFQADANGVSGGFNIIVGKLTGQAGRGSASKAVEKCQLTHENLKKCLDDLGPLFLPRQPVSVGAVWTRKLVDVQRGVGTITTIVKCTLRSVTPSQGRDIALIDVAGEYSLVSEKIPVAPTTTRPGQPTTAPAKTREYRIDRAAYSGTVEFDVTAGALKQYSLRREFGVAADLEAQSMGPMTLKTAFTQNMKLTVSREPTPAPVIVGGKKPPVVPKDDSPRIGGSLAHTATTQKTTTTQPAGPRAPAGSSTAQNPGMKNPQPPGNRKNTVNPNSVIEELRPPNRPASPSRPPAQPITRPQPTSGPATSPASPK